MAGPPKTTTFDDFRAARNRVVIACLVAALVLGGGAVGYWYLGFRQDPGLWPFRDCLYMTAVTITTVGFHQVLDVDTVAYGREWTLILLVFGIGANLYVISSFTSFFVEGDFVHIQRYRRLQRQMRDLSNHYIVCGVGSTGHHVVEELLAVGERVVAIDEDESVLQDMPEAVIKLTGDATDDDTLATAGLDRAKGIVSALDDDKTNMFVVVTARQSNPHVRIVAKAVTPSAVTKLRRAGADAVVSPNYIGGMRMASEILRPQVVRFLDEMLRDSEARLRIEEAHVQRDGPAVGQTLGDADLRARSGALIMAIREPDGSIEHAPAPDRELAAGQVLIAIGRPEQIDQLRELVSGTTNRA